MEFYLLSCSSEIYQLIASTRYEMLTYALAKSRYFLFTYLTTTTVPSFTAIQTQFSITYSQVNWTVAIPALGLAVGPLIWTSLSDIYGRRVIFLIGTVIALVSTIGAAVADTYAGYMAARFFQGFGVSPASTVGMAVGMFQLFSNPGAWLMQYQ
jgi:Arabinose efflux permease